MIYTHIHLSTIDALWYEYWQPYKMNNQVRSQHINSDYIHITVSNCTEATTRSPICRPPPNSSGAAVTLPPTRYFPMYSSRPIEYW